MLFSSSRNKKLAAVALACNLFLTLLLIPAPPLDAADHGDAPGASVDRSADINDVYLFLDPTDNSKVVILLTVHGFLVPAEAVNFGVFDHNLRYRFELEANGDPVPDTSIDVTFSQKINTGATPQTATISSTFLPTFTAPTTVPNLSTTPPTPVITNDPGTGIAFFAGVVDDPFFFDIPAFSRFVASVLGGQPNPAVFNRGRDSFAGYNTLSIGFSIPAQLLRTRLNVANNSVGVVVRTQRRINTVKRPLSRNFTDVDRMGNPGVNVALVPFARKDEYNLGTAQDDANGRYAASIIGTLMALGTNQVNIGILAQVAVLRGDFLRVNLTTPNTGPGSGTNPGAAFPNGRRLADDVIDTILFFVANQNVLSDNANANDLPFRDAFPFFAPPQQPRNTGVIDDNTRN